MERRACVADRQPARIIASAALNAAVALSEGEVADCTLECWLHGSTFDLSTGKPTGPPATDPVATFPVEIRETTDGDMDVYVDVDTTLNGVTPA